MGVYVANGKNLMLNALGAVATYASVHTATPNSSGSNEASGGSYARVAVSFGAASGGSMSHGSLTWNVPAGTFTHIGYWSAPSGGTFYGFDDLASSEVFGSAGTLNVSGGTLTIADS